MINWKELVYGAVLDTGATTYYTAPDSTYATIQAVSVYNPTAAPVTFAMFRVRSGGVAEDANRICSRIIAPGAVLQAHEAINHKLEPLSRLMAQGLGLTMNVSGVEYIPES